MYAIQWDRDERRTGGSAQPLLVSEAAAFEMDDGANERHFYNGTG
jgi:hypothetical protein